MVFQVPSHLNHSMILPVCYNSTGNAGIWGGSDFMAGAKESDASPSPSSVLRSSRQ